MANLSRNGSDALTEVHNQDNLNYDLFNQSEQIMTSSEQSNDVRNCPVKEQIKSLKGNVEDRSVKMDMDEIETLNIE
ncbi:hypothetical protein Tco_0358548 [Tanacetum coccineum]